MGVWAASISASDDFQDVKYTFFDLFYHEKVSITEIQNRIINNYSESIQEKNSGEWHDVYFAIAYCEWKCGTLDENILSIVEKIIKTDANLTYWKKLGADL